MKKPSAPLATAFDQYTLGAKIGEGRAGSVYAAHNRESKEVAVKILNPAVVTSTSQKRFQNEINFGLRTSHPNVLKILDVGAVSVDGQTVPFYVMKRFDDTLANLLKKTRSADDTLEIFIQILNGVEAAHLLKVFHRDLKPQNILASADAREIVVADFGIAHFEEDEIYTAAETKVTDRMANFRYAAPEQTDRSMRVDHRADIFALGQILNEMFTGSLAVGTGYTKVGSVSAQYGFLDTIIEKMIQASVVNRFESIEAIKSAIELSRQTEIVRQRVDSATKQVVDDSEPDDPLISHPIRIAEIDWRDSALRLKLSGQANPLWEETFRGIGYHDMILGSDPRFAKIFANTLVVPVEAHNAEAMLKAYGRHIENTNREYARRAIALHKTALATKRENQRVLAGKEVERLKVLEQLKTFRQ